jgi:hypothetical protein
MTSLSDKIEIYKDKESGISIKVKVDKRSLWLDQYQIAAVFETDRTSIGRHIKNIYSSRELYKKSTCAKIAQVQKEGERSQFKFLTV